MPATAERRSGEGTAEHTTHPCSNMQVAVWSPLGFSTTTGPALKADAVILLIVRLACGREVLKPARMHKRW